ncbi:MAG: Gfo/Idh/MocA family protein [Boseongicola sp.]
MSGAVRLGIIGAGAIANAYAAAAKHSEGANLTAIADINLQAANNCAESAKAEKFNSHRELLESDLCDAVIVSTPPATHEAIVLDAVARGVPVLCEKPFAVEGASARRMAKAAREQNVLVAMASKFRYVDDLSSARDMVKDGAIGDLRLIENVFTGVVDMRERWNSQKEISGGGVLIDNGTHSVDIIRFLAGPIWSVSAINGPRIQPIEVEDHVFAFVRTEAGVLANLETSWSIHKDRAHFIELHGESGTIQLGWKKSRIRRTLTGPWEEFGSGYDKVAAFTGQVNEFVKGVRGNPTATLGTLADAIASVDAISAGYASICESGQWVTVEDVAARPRLELLTAVS